MPFSLSKIKMLAFASLLPLFAMETKANEEVSLAIVAPMSGVSNSVGQQYKVGVSAALKQLDGGKLLGHKIHVNTYDDGCNAKIATKVATVLSEKPPVAVIGHSCSLATIAAAPIYAQNGILQITPASTNPKVTEMGIATIFRVIGRDDAQGKMAAQRLMSKYKDKRIGLFYFKGDYGEGLKDITIEELSHHGIKPAKIIMGLGDTDNFVEDIEAFIKAEIDVLYFIGGGFNNAVFVRQARQMGAPFDFISTDTMISKTYRENAGNLGDGIAFTFPPEAGKLSSSKVAVDAIKAMGEEPIGYTLLAYAATEAWIEAIRRAKSFNAAIVAKEMRKGKIDTILGQVSFDEKGDVITNYDPFAWYTWKNGKRIAID